MTESKETCVLCGKELAERHYSPAPLADYGRCCNECNTRKVLPARKKHQGEGQLESEHESD
jgi:hypothetical protein